MNKILRVVLDQNDLCAVKFVHKGSRYIMFSFLIATLTLQGMQYTVVSLQQPLNILYMRMHFGELIKLTNT